MRVVVSAETLHAKVIDKAICLEGLGGTFQHSFRFRDPVLAIIFVAIVYPRISQDEVKSIATQRS